MNVIIIGAGAVGLSSAYYLAKNGARVKIFTKESEADHSSASYGNAGMIVPSHFTPLAAPGVIKDGLKWMLDPKSPFSIKPSFNASMLKWLWKFNASATKDHVVRSRPLLLQMNSLSRDLFVQLDQEITNSFDYKQNGLMMHYLSARYQDEEEEMAEKARSFGLDVEILSKNDIREKESELDCRSIGAVLYKSDAHLNPNAFMQSLKSELQQMGVSFHYDSEVSELESVNKKIVSIKVGEETYSADEYLICSGAWSEKLLRSMNSSILLQGGKGYHMHLSDSSKQLSIPSILCEARVAMTPMGYDIRVSGSMEIAGLDRSVNMKKVQGIVDGIKKFFPALPSEEISKYPVWAGLRPVSPDGLPYIGRLKSYWNLSVNTGHAMMGLSLAPVSGKLIADQLMHARTDIDIQLLDPDRFH